MMSLKVPGWRGVLHKDASVQLYTADVFVADPDVYMGRLKAVFSRIDNETELALYCYSRHAKSSGELMPLMQPYARSVSYNDTFYEVLQSCCLQIECGYVEGFLAGGDVKSGIKTNMDMHSLSILGNFTLSATNKCRLRLN